MPTTKGLVISLTLAFASVMRFKTSLTMVHWQHLCHLKNLMSSQTPSKSTMMSLISAKYPSAPLILTPAPPYLTIPTI
ncbi:hypothetical protein RHMOL_Rhmol11G0007700 [Rhododendron molle]|uniref:Uncharacterized protein n=1 Tax=Rhododendron molle TaxID=49168 RepID=A0ACC0LMQ1_RHOML|nr:hypothetical protein RHMOL_Rhmol11G0007700 [Rhododendron molle]